MFPPVLLLGSSCGARGRMLKLRIDRNIRALPRFLWVGKHNECLKYVCYHIIMAKGQDSNSLFTNTLLCIFNRHVYNFPVLIEGCLLQILLTQLKGFKRGGGGGVI